MPLPITSPSPESFITSVIGKISLLAPCLPSIPSSQLLSSNRAPPPEPENFSTRLSALPKEDQESITRLLTTLHFLFPHDFIPALDLLDRALVTRMIIGPLSSPTSASEAPERKPHVDHQASLSNASMGDLPSAPDIHVAGAESCHRQETDPTTLTNPEMGHESEIGNEVFYVRSASSQTNAARQRRRHYTGVSSTTYEVRLAAWNCTCPAFALSAFNRITDLNSDGDDHKQEPPTILPAGNNHHNSAKSQLKCEWRFGGTLTRTVLNLQSEIDSDRRGTSVPVPVPVPVPVCKHILAALLGKHIPGLFGSGVQLRTVTAEEAAGWAGGWGDGD